jgi:hypothetical protein
MLLRGIWEVVKYMNVAIPKAVARLYFSFVFAFKTDSTTQNQKE